MRSRLLVSALAVCSALVCAPAARAAGQPAGAGAVAQAADPARGRVLYEARCGACHDRSVHNRAARSAKTFAEVRANVARWDRELGALWRADEIDAVARYLNDTYYRYPCPQAVCGAERAQGGAPVAAGPR